MVSSSEVIAYAELFTWTNFSFLKSSAHPEAFVSRADKLGYEAIAIVDECSLAGIVRAYCEALERNINVLYGSSFIIGSGLYLVLIAKNKHGYGDICALVSQCRRKAQKGEYNFALNDIEHINPKNVISLFTFINRPSICTAQKVLIKSTKLLRIKNFKPYLLINRSYKDGEEEWISFLCTTAKKLNLPICASNLARMTHERQKPLLDLVYAIDRNRTLEAIAGEIEQNGQYYLKSKKTIYRQYESEWIKNSVRLARKCSFNLRQIVYQYPAEVTPKYQSPSNYLRQLVIEGAKKRWPSGTPLKIKKLIKHELKLIKELQYEFYFLTVYDIVRFARSQKILCQGRGSAANSVVCYCLGITEVNPAEIELLFERFISKERQEPPDIDVDFENARREEVIQYLYTKYGRQRAALTATVITYRSKSAYRDTAKALGFDAITLKRVSKSFSWRDSTLNTEARLLEAGLNPNTQKVKWLILLAEQLKTFPRHLSQHVGGMVLCHEHLDRMVPIENTAMDNRTVIQWDKNDIDALGILKVDCLALGMLTALKYALMDISLRLKRNELTFKDIPKNDPAVYDMICRADTIGVFQIESRAQMSMLPRLRPRNFYDLVIEVSIVRPGPIQGDMVHPYLRRRQGLEAITYPSDEVKDVLKRTLGVPIFQEQVIKLAMVAAGFSAGEADRLRRSMAAWRRSGSVEEHKEPLIEGMLKRGYSHEFAQQIYNQIRGFGEYGFPESHAASFSILVYYSCWVKYHYPDIFLTSLLNAQPMGFYRPAQLVEDARRHGVDVLAPNLLISEWHSTTTKPMRVQLGFHQIKGIKKEEAEKLLKWRKRYYASNGINHAPLSLNERESDTLLSSLLSCKELNPSTLEILAKAGGLRAMSYNRHHALWRVITPTPTPFIEEPASKVVPLLPVPTKWQESIADYRYTYINQQFHPLALLRPSLNNKYIHSDKINQHKDKEIATIGLIINRQRPGKGNVLFITLEDEFGLINLILFANIASQFRKEVMAGSVLEVRGKVQVEREVTHLIVHQVLDRDNWIQGEFSRSRDFH